MRLPFSFVLVLCLAFTVSACARTQPVYNVIEAPVVTTSANTPTLAEVRNAIVTACVDVSNRWWVDPKIEGQIIARKELRGDTAVIDIFYSPTSYSIRYKNSDGLLYDGQQIDQAYNERVQLLRALIDKELNKL